MAKITTKQMQLHVECLCGYNLVMPIQETIAYKHFKDFGVKRKKDIKTGKWFLLKTESYECCDNCQPN